jgi:thiol-disulfide isomerase/thioredoxin
VPGMRCKQEDVSPYGDSICSPRSGVRLGLVGWTAAKGVSGCGPVKERNMKMFKSFLALAAVLLVMIPGLATASESFAVDAKILARMKLSMPEGAAAKDYLGLSNTGTFTMPQIKADTVIIEIFSMYCPICQAEAPVVNELHQLIENTPSLKGKVKLIGIGTGNSHFEVDVFRKKYNILFPLFPDEKFLIQKALSEPIRTPTFIAIRHVDGKGLKVQRTHIGGIKPEQFLKELMAAQSPK